MRATGPPRTNRHLTLLPAAVIKNRCRRRQIDTRCQGDFCHGGGNVDGSSLDAAVSGISDTTSSPGFF